MHAPDQDATDRVNAWLERELGGTVVRIQRQPRWRPVWFADVDLDGAVVELCVRGDRTDMELIFPLEHEMRFQRLLHERGIPTAAVHGWIHAPAAYVMDRVAGRADFAGTADAERDAVVDHYVEILAAIHALDPTPFVAAGIVAARAPTESGAVGMARYEAVYQLQKRAPDAFLEFALGWLRRNPPGSRGRAAPVVWDSGQFHHADGRVLAVLDLELGHIGDPMMDLAAWRMRDTVLHYGDFAALYARYEVLSGAPVDLTAIRRHHVAFTLTNQLVFGAAIVDPPTSSDLMTNLQWCAETNLFATEALAEEMGIEVPEIDSLEERDASTAPAHGHLVDLLGSVTTDDEYLRYRLRTAFRTARHLQRADQVGDAVAAADLDDLRDLLGHRPTGWRDGEAEMEAFVRADADDGRHDARLVEVFHRRHLRRQALLGPPGSAMTRHLPIQRFGPPSDRNG